MFLMWLDTSQAVILLGPLSRFVHVVTQMLQGPRWKPGDSLWLTIDFKAVRTVLDLTDFFRVVEK
jgi:hypothetical protein